jgi:signal peptidase I
VADAATTRRLGDLALTVGAVVGTACLLMVLAGALGGLRPVVVLSGSMSPSIPAGSLALARSAPAEELRVGDVVTVAAGDRQVTHRIVSVTHHDGSATLRLQGDANRSPDEQPYDVRSAPRVVAAVPGAGRAVAWLSRPPGAFLLAGYAAFLLAIVTGRSGREDSGGDDRRTNRFRRKHLARKSLGSLRFRVAAGVLVLGFAASTATPAGAAWGDSVAVSGSSVSTYTVPPPPTFTCGALGALSVTFNWTAVPGATNYTLHYGTGGTQTRTVTGTTTKVVTAVSGGTAWLQANRTFGATTWTSAPSATRTYTVAVVSLCS